MTTPADLFVLAARKKLRFESGRGYLTVEDLFDLSLESLDRIAIALDAKVSATGKKSFIGKRDRAAADEARKFEIVKFVIGTKMAEDEKAKARVTITGQKQFLQELLARKKTTELEALPLEEIEKRIAALEPEPADEE